MIYLLITFLSFNSLPIYSFGVVGKQASFYLALLYVPIFLMSSLVVKNKKISVYKNVFTIWMLLLFWVGISYIWNIDSIRSSTYLGINGAARFVEQLIQLIFGMLLSIAIANSVLTKRSLDKILVVIKYSVCASIFYGLFQYLAYSVGGIFFEANLFISGFFSETDTVIAYAQRGAGIHAFSSEPSLYAAFLLVVGPFVVIHSLECRRYILPLFFVIALGLTGSRSGYVIGLLQALMILVLRTRGYISFSGVLKKIPAFSLVTILLSLTSFSLVVGSLLTVDEVGSNATRFAAAFAGLSAWFYEGPIFGVGLGQYGFYGLNHLPQWGLITDETQAIAAGERWPFTHNLFITLLSELGVVGFVLFWAVFASIFFACNRRLREAKYLEWRVRVFGQATIVSLVGLFLTLFVREPIGNLNIWVCFGMALLFLRLSGSFEHAREYVARSK